MLSSPIGRLRLFSMLEAVSFLVLLAFSFDKNVLDGGETGVKVMGPVHGVLFVIYVIAALDVRARLRWPAGTTVKVLLAAVIPFAPFFVERWLRTQQAPAPAGRAG